MNKTFNSTLLAVVALIALSLCGGCARFNGTAQGSVKQIGGSSVVERQEVSVPVMEQADQPPAEYRLGPGDLVNVSVESASEVTAKLFVAPAAMSGGATVYGYKVDGAGTIVLPIAGRVTIGGSTISQAQTQIEEALRKYVREPKVMVALVQGKSQPLYLLGQFRTPGVYYLENPVRLIEGVAMGHGPDPTANLRGARILRNNRVLPVDIYDVLYNGDIRQNIWLQGGDTIFIPDAKSQPVYVFGAVKTPGAVPMANGQLSLLQALAITGFGDLSYDKNIRIIRSLSTTRGELIVVDYEKIMKGEAMPFMLAEGDIIFVPTSSIGNWNTALKELLPTLQAVGDVINPFVQMKYLFGRSY